jgi:tRNA-specific 2-thiouridylase
MTGSSVLVAMSGGVDSSVAAALLVDAGHHVVGVTMRLWGGESDTGCCSVSDVDDARRVADQLGIDHHVFNFSDDFERHVVEPYVRDHAEGRTPNPCIECNRHLKFDRLLRRAELLGFAKVATGHHAQVWCDDGGTWHLGRGADRAKDQSYVLNMADQSSLAHTLLPVGHLQKDQVREEAARRGLRTAAKPDSQDVCFIQRSAGRAEFLARRIPLHSAEVLDVGGASVGRVDAVELVTLGQRRGLGVGGSSEPRHVIDVDVPGRRVRLGSAADLLCDSCEMDRVTWVAGPVEGALLVQVSAHGDPAGATVHPAGDATNGWTVRWDRPRRRVAPGQSIVLYDLADERVLGAGIAR